MNNNFEIAILPNGDIRYCRCNPEINKAIYKIVTKINESKKEEIADFLSGSEQVENILGNDILCG